MPDLSFSGMTIINGKQSFWEVPKIYLILPGNVSPEFLEGSLTAGAS